MAIDRERPRRGFRLVRDEGADRRALFEKLYRESFPKVYGYIYSRVLNRTLAEDITSEAFLKAARAFDSFDPSKAAFSTWVITIARNHMISEARKSKSEVLAEDVSYDLELVSTTDEYEGLDDTERQAQRLLALLDEEERELVHLKYYEGMKNKDIAEVMGMNASTVGTKLQRAMAKMRAQA